MAVTNVTLQSETTSDDRQFVFKYVRTFLVEHAASDTSRSILSDSQVPQMWSIHPNDGLAYVESRNLDRSIDTGKVVSLLTVNYTTDREAEQETEDPTLRPARITWSTQNERVPILFDKDDNPIVNDAGDLLIGVEEDRALWQITVAKNVVSVPSWVTSYQNAVNSDAVTIGGAVLDAGTLKMDAINISDQQTENGVAFYEISFQMLFRQDGWDQKLLNVGLREIVETTIYVTAEPTTIAELRPILTSAGEPVDEPVFLDSNGKAIRDETVDPDGNVKPLKTNLSSGEIVTKTYSTKDTKAFSVLPFT